MPTAASRAFTNLEADGVAKVDWKGVSLAARQRSDEVFERFYMELRQVEKGLAYLRHVAESAAEGVGKLRSADKEAQFLPCWVPTWIWGTKSGLAEEKSKIKRTLDSFQGLVEHARGMRALSQADINSLEDKLDLLMATEPKDPEAGAFGDPGAFFQKGIDSLNSGFEAERTGSTASRPTDRHQKQDGEQDMAKADGGQEVVPISMDDPEAASFVMDLHTAQGAGSLFHGSFKNVKMRLQRLSKAMQDEDKLADNMKRDLGRIKRLLGGAKTPEELQPLAKELVSLAKEWLSTIQKRFYE